VPSAHSVGSGLSLEEGPLVTRETIADCETIQFHGQAAS
jgi:hypothetical protein